MPSNTSRPAAAETDVAAGLWRRCPGCERLVYERECSQNLEVCPRCTHHFPLGAEARIRMFTDRDSFRHDPVCILPRDPLRFVDTMEYPARLEDSRSKSGLDEAVMWGTAEICGMRVAVAAMEFAFMGGSMGSAVGEAVSRAARNAVDQAIPLVIFCASGGARMQEGVYSLMQMAKTSAEMGRLAERALPYVSVLTHPTTGGVAASFATQADVVISETGALFGFTGPRVIEQTIRERLPKGFQSAEFCLERGMVDMVVKRHELKKTLAAILSTLSGYKEIRGRGKPSFALPDSYLDHESPRVIDDHGRSAWDTVRLARHDSRPRFRYYSEEVFSDFLELHGDRLFGDDPAIIGGLARLDGIDVMLVGHNRGRGPGNPPEPRANNNGMPHPEGIRKAMRLVRLAEKFRLPVVTLIDTPGAYPGVSAEERGQAVAISSLIREMVSLEAPVISVIIGEGGSGGALSLAVADRLLMMENSTFSVISPEGCAAILWRDASRAPEAAQALMLTAPDLLGMGIIDGIVPEPPGGAHGDPAAAAEMLGRHLKKQLREIRASTLSELVESRYLKYRSIGEYEEREVST